MGMQTWGDGRTRATDAVESIRAGLAALGVPESAWDGVRPMVTRTGRPYVDLGTLRADVAEQVTEALRGAMTSARRRAGPSPSRNGAAVHHHGYAWVGEKKTSDNESIRRPPPEHASPVGIDAVSRERYRNTVADFPATGVPPIQTAHWLMKPASMVRGTERQKNPT